MRNQFRAWTLNPGGITNEVSGGLRTSSAKGFVRRIIGHAVNLWQGPYRATAVMAGEGTDWSCVQTNVSSCVQPVTQPRRRANTVALGPYHEPPSGDDDADVRAGDARLDQHLRGVKRGTWYGPRATVLACRYGRTPGLCQTDSGYTQA